MNRFASVSLASVVAGIAVAFAPIGASAQTAPAEFTADQLRADYMAHGYQADAPVTWWTPDQVTTFRVSDPTSHRVLMVLVYPDTATAELERSRAEAHDNTPSQDGPHLVDGYGVSTWRGNVALVESTTAQLERRYAEAQAANNGMSGANTEMETAERVPTNTVDADMINVMDTGRVDL